MLTKNISTYKKRTNVITPKTFGMRDIYFYYINLKVKEDSSYFIEKEVLYMDVEEKKKLLKDKIKYYEDKIRYIKEVISYREDKITIDISKNLYTANSTARKLKNILTKLPSKDIIKVIDYPIYKSIIKTHNELLQDKLIHGYRFLLSSNLGYLEPRIIARNHKKKSIDHNATRLRKKKLLDSGVDINELYHSIDNPTGKIKYTVYFTDDHYLRMSWSKSYKLPNISVYRFEMSGGQKGKGFRNKFTKSVKENPHLKSLYSVHQKKKN